MNQKIAVLIIFICVVVGLFMYHNKNKKRIHLLNHSVYTTGRITQYLKGSRGGSMVVYSYNADGAQKENSNEYGNINFNLGNELIGHYFAVFFDSANNDVYDILIIPQDFKNVHLIFPDTLSWVKKLLY